MRSISCVSAWLLIVAAAPVNAQLLSEAHFLEDAVASHPRVVAAEAEVAAASGATRQARVFDNPEIEWEREAPDVAPRQDTWRMSWRLPFDGRTHRVAAANAAEEAARFLLESTRLEVRLEMRGLFASWYIAAEREQILAEHVGQTRRLAEWMRARADLGEAAGVEARRLELELEVISRQLAEARADVWARRAAAATWSGLVSDGTVPDRPPLAPPPSSVNPTNRPDLVALEYRVAQSEARERLAARVVEPPSVSVGWLELREGSQSVDGPVFGVSWPVPVFDRKQGRRQAAAAEVERSRALLAAARRRAEENAEAALAAYVELYRATDPSSSRTPGDDIVIALLAAFEAGEATLTDVLDALRTTVDAQLARLGTLNAALDVERRLEAAVGSPILSGASS